MSLSVSTPRAVASSHASGAASSAKGRALRCAGRPRPRTGHRRRHERQRQRQQRRRHARELRDEEQPGGHGEGAAAIAACPRHERQHRAEQPAVRQQVGPGAGPGHRLDPHRVHGEDRRRGRGRQPARFGWTIAGRQRRHEEEEQHGVCGMQPHRRRVDAGRRWRPSGHRVERQPAKRLVVFEEPRGRRPSHQAPIARLARRGRHDDAVVPVQEGVVAHRPEGDQCGGGDGQRAEQRQKGGSGRGRWRFGRRIGRRGRARRPAGDEPRPAHRGSSASRCRAGRNAGSRASACSNHWRASARPPRISTRPRL